MANASKDPSAFIQKVKPDLMPVTLTETEIQKLFDEFLTIRKQTTTARTESTTSTGATGEPGAAPSKAAVLMEAKLQEALKGIRDIERTTGRLGQLSGNARDVQVLSTSLQQMPEIQEHLKSLLAKSAESADPEATPSLASALLPRLRAFPELVDYLMKAIIDEPPATLKDGGIFREGFSADLDELRQASTLGKQWIADLQEREIERTGVKSLKCERVKERH